MVPVVERFLDGLEPGAVVDVEKFGEQHGQSLKRLLLDELEGRGFVLDSNSRLGEVEVCPQCDSEGEIKGRACPLCDGFTLVVNFGRGLKPFGS